MIDLNPQGNAGPLPTSVVLDCGADEARLEAGDVELLGSAIDLVIPWEFPPGTCIQMTFKQTASGNVVRAETMVADSRPCPERKARFLTTLLILRSEVRARKQDCQGPPSYGQAVQLCALL